EARRVAAVRPVSTSIVLSGVENAATGPANDRTFRSRWRERHGGGATERLLVADDAARPGCVTVLSPIEGGGPVRVVDSGALGDLLRRVAGRPRLEVVRELADELDRLDLRIGPAQRFALDILRDPTVLLPPDADRAEQAVTFERSSTVRHAPVDHAGQARRRAHLP
ncbi:MAG: hypothetical protein M3431_11515, partial [Actinomycetota bacterium]|nr:hypothetical protein [Actinomycetota bacterium]